MLGPDDYARVTAAIEAAERQTAGEILCTISYERHRYREWLLAVAAAAAFLLPAIVTVAGFGPSRWLAMWSGWHGHSLSDTSLVLLFLAAQLVVLLLATLALWWSPVGQRFAPLALRRTRVHKIAMQQFLIRGLHLTSSQTGVLIHASVHDHVVEVVADGKIHALVPPDQWAVVASAVSEGFRRGDPAGGFVDAVGLAGRLLADHFPPTADNIDEVPNRLLVV